MIVYICDDDRAWLEQASGILQSYADEHGLPVSIECFGSTEELSSVASSPGAIYRSGISGPPDVLFIDIEFEDEPEGIDAAKLMSEAFPDCKIVFLTNYLNYALDVYSTDHIWYVIKDQFGERLHEIFRKIGTVDAESRSVLAIVTTDGTVARVVCSDILYMERDNRRTRIITRNGSYEARSRLPDILDKLPQTIFTRCHASFVVNLNRVREIHSGTLTLDDGTKLIISRGFGKSFRLKFMELMKNRVID